MVFTQTILKCADNSGALLVKCLRVLGKSPRCRGSQEIMLLFQLRLINLVKKLKKVKYIKRY